MRDGLLAVRPAAPEDAEGIALVHVRAWQAGYRGLMSQTYLDGLDIAGRADFWRRQLGQLRDGSRLLVATVDGRVAGFVGFGGARDTESGDGGELHALNVHPDWWRGGVGSSLLSHAHAGLADLGYVRSVLWVAAGNVRACQFYQRRGWAREDVRRSLEVQGVVVPELRYARALP